MKSTDRQPARDLSHRPRRWRNSAGVRRMLQNVSLGPADFVYPIFVSQAATAPRAIESMPGQYQWSIDRLDEILLQVRAAKIPAVMLFGIPAEKDGVGSGAYAEDGVVQQAIRQIKSIEPELVVIADTCLCEYTSHGHCGVLGTNRSGQAADAGAKVVLNDPTLDLLIQTAISQAAAGADMVAPSGMMDAMVAAIRQGMDIDGFSDVGIMAYSVKFASAYYGPFRDAAGGAPAFGDRRTHQMDPASSRGILTEAALDIAQAADWIMVKPALAYLDVIRQLRSQHPDFPLAAYNVSGEYAMVKAAAANGWIDERQVVLETLLGMKRAGADTLISYHAVDVCRWLAEADIA